MKLVSFVLMVGFSLSVTAQNLEANEIINLCIKKHGGDNYQNAHFSYDFRKYHYEFHYEKGKYRYERHSKDGSVVDILTNQGFTRKMDGKEVDLSEKDSRKYSNSVNSVHYFAFLPFFLNDQAVNKRLIGEAKVKDKDYYKIEVTFDQEGGGDDHDDVYMYWIAKDDYTMDYLAYSFHVNGGGVRFRSAYNKRTVGGITFQDYINYKHDKNTPVSALDALYEVGELKELSKIELVNVRGI
ncbi:MAG: DUF6503 family protein [Bacteroidota bacterium]